jgi:hypothetical protein
MRLVRDIIRKYYLSQEVNISDEDYNKYLDILGLDADIADEDELTDVWQLAQEDGYEFSEECHEVEDEIFGTNIQ